MVVIDLTTPQWHTLDHWLISPVSIENYLNMLAPASRRPGCNDTLSRELDALRQPAGLTATARPGSEYVHAEFVETLRL